MITGIACLVGMLSQEGRQRLIVDVRFMSWNSASGSRSRTLGFDSPERYSGTPRKRAHFAHKDKTDESATHAFERVLRYAG